MRIVHLFLMLLLFNPVLLFAQTTWYVPDDFSTIQGALSDTSVVNGDTVIVRPGTYVENIDTLGKAVTLAGEAGAEATVIDGGQVRSVIQCLKMEGEDTVIRGFTLTNGAGYNYGHIGLIGGGMFCEKSSPTVEECVFTKNTAFQGGGMYNLQSSPTLLRCDFVENSAYVSGAMFNNSFSRPRITYCSFIRNTADLHCGGMYNNNYCNPELDSCVFIGNSAQSSTGAMYITNSSAPLVANCTFFNNTAAYEGAVTNSQSELTAIFANCILWGNAPEEITTYNADPLVTYCCVQGGWPGAGNIDVDPLFVDPMSDDLHLTYLSPCRNAGHNGAVDTPEDFEGDPRIRQGTVDMGADEFYRHLYMTGERTPGGSIQGKFVGLPGTTPVGLFIGSGISPTPANTMWGEYWLQAPWFLFPLIPIPSNGILELPTTLPGSIPAPYDIPMQALIGLNADSLTNLCVLEVR